MSQENESVTADAEMLIECDETLDVSVASDFKALLQQVSAQDHPIVLDGSRIERVDGAALQLLAAFFLDARESGLDVAWRNPPDTLQDAAKNTGLKDILRL